MTRTLRFALTLLACLGLAHLALLSPAWADDDDDDKPKTTPRLEVEGVVEFRSDSNVKSDDPDAEITDTYNTTELAFGWFVNRVLSFHGGFTFEPVLDPPPGTDRFFEDHGLYAEELYAALQFGRVRVFGGKFNPSFGTAWDKAPGLYGVAFRRGL